MAYTKNYGGDWKNYPDVTTPITEATLDNLETQYDEAVAAIAIHAALANVHHGIATGSYVGNETARQVTTGFKCSMVIITSFDGQNAPEQWVAIPNATLVHYQAAAKHADDTVRAFLHATDGFSLDNTVAANKTGSTYYYWAISE